MASRALLHRLQLAFLSVALMGLIVACAGPLPPVIPPGETRPAPEQSPTASPDAHLLALPAAFRFRVHLHPAGQPDALSTLIDGEYRDGAWQQLSGQGRWDFDIPDQELIVARDAGDNALRSYTRAFTDTVWTRWPGVTFEAAYGLSSPFTLLRLRPLATQTAALEEQDETSGPANTTRTQAFFSPDTVQRLLMAGVEKVAADAESRAALQEQIAAQFAPQTLVYWTDADGNIQQVVGTLLTLGPDGRPAPWLEVTASFDDYGNPAITVAAPAESSDIGDLAVTTSEERPLPVEMDPSADITLRIRVFATAGQPADDAIVTVYPKGKQTVVDEKLGADAQFALKPGQYDVLVRAGGAEQWLKDVVVTEGVVTSNDALFDFAQLTVAVVLNGAAPAVDVVVYPAGERVRFAGFATGNPARFQLPAGLYDVEVATTDGNARKRVEGVEVRGGLETTQTIDLAQP